MRRSGGFPVRGPVPPGVSARRLRADFTGRVNRVSVHGHFWSYFAASSRGAPLSIIRQYIEQQRPA